MPIPQKLKDKRVELVNGPYAGETLTVPGFATAFTKLDPETRESWTYIIRGSQALGYRDDLAD
jgi:hypothetical protein